MGINVLQRMESKWDSLQTSELGSSKEPKRNVILKGIVPSAEDRPLMEENSKQACRKERGEGVDERLTVLGPHATN